MTKIVVNVLTDLDCQDWLPINGSYSFGLLCPPRIYCYIFRELRVDGGKKERTAYGRALGKAIAKFYRKFYI